MKNDREFIEGIYEKVNRYNEVEKLNTPVKKFTYLKPALITGFSLVAIIAIVLVIKPYIDSIKPINEINNENMVRNVNPSASSSNDSDTYPLVNIITGTILNVDLENKTFTLKDITPYKQKPYVENELTISYSGIDLDEDILIKDNKLLLYVTKMDNKLMLENGISSVYIYLDQGENYDIYKGYDGTIIDTKSIIE